MPGPRADRSPQTGQPVLRGQVLHLDAVGYRWPQEDNVDVMAEQGVEVVCEVEAAHVDLDLRVPRVQQAQDSPV